MSTPPTATGPRLRLALCAAGELFGGVERQILGLCSYWREQGTVPLLLLFHDRELATQVRQLGIEPHILPARHSYDPRGVAALAQRLAAHRINVVHAHGYRAMVNCALAFRKHHFTLVKTEHGWPEPCAGRPLRWAKGRFYRGLELWATRRTDAAVCYVTADIRRRWARFHAGRRRWTVHNGIDPLEGSVWSRPPEFAAGGFHLVMAGRLTAVKGIADAIRAMAGDMPADIRLVILGEGPARPHLERLAAELRLADRVRWLGFRRHIHAHLAHADAVLMPSLHEGLPYTLLEAMSLARPILASRVGGLAEVLRDGETALLFEPRDIPGLRRAVVRIHRQRDLALRLGQAARREQVARYTLTAMGDRYREIFERLLEGEGERHD